MSGVRLCLQDDGEVSEAGTAPMETAIEDVAVGNVTAGLDDTAAAAPEGGDATTAVDGDGVEMITADAPAVPMPVRVVWVRGRCMMHGAWCMAWYHGTSCQILSRPF